MGKFLALTLDARPVQTKTKSHHDIKSNQIFWIFALLACFGIFYLLIVNNLSTKGYEIKRLEKRIGELNEMQKRLGVESAALQSVQQIEETVQTLNLVPSKEINYPKGNGYAYDDITVE